VNLGFSDKFLLLFLIFVDIWHDFWDGVRSVTTFTDKGQKNSEKGGSTVRSLTMLNATVSSRLTAGTAWVTAKRYKVFPIRVKYRSMETIKSTHLFCSSSCREPGSNSFVQLYLCTYCTPTPRAGLEPMITAFKTNASDRTATLIGIIFINTASNIVLFLWGRFRWQRTGVVWQVDPRVSLILLTFSLEWKKRNSISPLSLLSSVTFFV
jgi:hypothetical protein